MNKNNRNQALALAAILQAAKLVTEVANHGTADEREQTILLSSIFELNPKNFSDIYGGTAALATGLDLLQTLLSPSNPGNRIMQDYLLAIMRLERKFHRRKTMQRFVHDGILDIDLIRKTNPSVNNILKPLATLYLSSFGTLSMRIQVKGESRYLQDDDCMARIRSLLLSGIRAAVLWRQVGGSKYQLAFARKQLLNATTQLLEQVNENHVVE